AVGRRVVDLDREVKLLAVTAVAVDAGEQEMPASDLDRSFRVKVLGVALGQPPDALERRTNRVDLRPRAQRLRVDGLRRVAIAAPRVGTTHAARARRETRAHGRLLRERRRD